MRARLHLLCALGALALSAPASAPAASIPNGATVLLSGSASLLDPLPAPVGSSGQGASAISANGQFVAFRSASDGLLDGDDDDAVSIYRKDMTSGEVMLVSRRDGATGEPAHRECWDATISDDGNRVGFTCTESLAPGIDDNIRTDVYVRDVREGRTHLVSRAGNLGPVGNGSSELPALSGDGTFVAFESRAGNLVPGAVGRSVYRRRIGGGDAVELASRGAQSKPIEGREPAISDSGTRVAFVTEDEELEPGGGNHHDDVYVRDLGQDTTTIASRGQFGGLGDKEAQSPAISGDGQVVAFASRSSNLTVGDSGSDLDIYRRSLSANTTTLVTKLPPGGTPDVDAYWPAVDFSGGRVAFVTSERLHAADTNDVHDAYLWHGEDDTVQVLTRADGAAGAVGDRDAERATLSGSGTHAAVETWNADLVPGGEPHRAGVVVRDVVAGTTRLATRPAGTAPFVNAGGTNRAARTSADGRYTAFQSDATGLGVPAVAYSAIVVRDRVTGRTEVASLRDGAGRPFLWAEEPAISADGRRVAFAAPETATGPEQIWVRDLASGRTFLASRADGPAGAAGNGTSEHPALDADGTRVAFESVATNLGPDADPAEDVFVRDLPGGETILAGRGDGVAGSNPTAPTGRPDIDAGGRMVTFTSVAPGLAGGDQDAHADAFVRDVESGTTRLISAPAVGAGAGGNVDDRTSIDAAGSRVAFASNAADLPGPAGVKRPFVRDLRTGALTSVAAAGDDVALSPDGRFVAYADDAGVHRHDLAGGSTDLVRAAGSDPDVSTLGGCVTFQHLRKDEDLDIGMRAFADDCGDPAPSAPAAAVPGPPRPPLAARPRAARDVRAPRLTAVKLDRTRLKARKAKATLRFRASEAGTLVVAIQRPTRGRRTGTRKVCTPVRKRPRRGACTAYRPASTASVNVRAGAGKLVLDRRLRRLQPGRYRLSITLRDAAGNRSTPVTLGFGIA